MLSLVVNFHGVGPVGRSLEDGEDRVWTSSEETRRILDLLVGRDDVIITADDGNLSDVELLLPAMKERSLRGTFFLLAGRLDQPGFVGRSDVRRLVDEGMSIGLHGHDHVPWRGLDATARRREWLEARHELEEVSGTAIVEAACPFGSYDRGVITGLGEAGITRIHTSDGGWTRSDGRILARNSVGAGLDSSAVERLLARPGIAPSTSLKRLLKRWR